MNICHLLASSRRENPAFNYHSIDGKEGNYLFNNALDTFYLWLHGVGHSDSEIGILMPPLHGLL